MNNLERILQIIFRRVSARSVLQENVDATDFDQNNFNIISGTYMQNYSESEISNMWMFYKNTFVSDKRNRHSGTYVIRDSFNVFDALRYFVRKMLVVQENEILCTYNEIQNWRELTLQLSEDLLVCAYCAGTMMPEDMEKFGFSWKTVIGHNNVQLNRIMERGISENHFHLYGSAPMFHISWISIMNHVDDAAITAKLRSYDQSRRNANCYNNVIYNEEPLTVQRCQAALIRLLLFTKIELTDSKKSLEDILRTILHREVRGEYTNHEIEDSLNEEPLIKKILNDRYELEACISDIQSEIVALQNSVRGNTGNQELLDYALLGVKDSYEDSNDIFSGERWFMYSCLNKIYRNEFDSLEQNLFYAYILLRENIRAELIQSNNRTGFVNFQNYQKRKKELIDAEIFEEEAVRKAVRENLLSDHVESLELRISPRQSVTGNLKQICKLDKIIGEPKDKYFYTLHFIKGTDEKDYTGEFVQCRHFEKRQQLKKCAQALIELREEYPECASRIRGIDAAANEIGCRPEVFATTFRILRNHVKMIEDDSEKRCYVPQLRTTYHVGEDFLDVADGLRAIDETVNFLNMDCGDRLGHALALGINVEEWYLFKNHTILLPKQDYLDNLVWIYNRMIQFNIQGEDSLKDYIQKKYEQYFYDVYGRFMDYGVIEKILENAEKEYRQRGINTIFKNDRCHFGISQFYESWKLRGDDPFLYSHGFFRWYDDNTPETAARINKRLPKDFNIRYNPEVFLLNYYYHYSNDVRRAGNERIEVKIKPDYVRAVAQIQKEMQKRIGRRGIAIETNPTSNFVIGTFKDYAKHPIFNFYNKNLTYDMDKLEDCPQLSVSVNTDDQGVFATSLENEYALLASALENVTDENGNYVYVKSMIYDWIDDVRRMGNDQSFKEQNGIRNA